ncbi:MAG: CRISPR-associated endonuclease Cas2 [Patescibacteria group bacterium]|jgi:CRISPR-associated endonuclease Cas2
MASTSRSSQVLSKASRLLYSIGELVDDVFFIVERPGFIMHSGGVGNARSRERRHEYQSNFHAMKRLKERKLIHVKKWKNGFICSLTHDGFVEFLRLKVLKTELLPQGKTCIVVFDIPETQRSKRRWLRRLLERAGFIPLQKSVWISPFDAGNVIMDFAKKMKMQDFIRVFIAEERVMTKKVRSDHSCHHRSSPV